MKKTASFLATSLLLLTAQNVNATDLSGWYIGGLYSDQSLSIHGRDFKSGGLIAGYQYNAFFSMEGRLTFGTSDYESFYGTPDSPQGVYQEKVDTQYSLHIKGSYPVTDRFNFYGLFGYTSTDLRFQGAGRPLSPDPSNDSFRVNNKVDGLSYGLGSEFKATDNLRVFVDHVILEDFDVFNSDARNWTTTNVGITWHF